MKDHELKVSLHLANVMSIDKTHQFNPYGVIQYNHMLIMWLAKNKYGPIIGTEVVTVGFYPRREARHNNTDTGIMRAICEAAYLATGGGE